MGSAAIAEQILERVTRLIPPGAEICVGFSGGIDSTVLLDVLTEHTSG